MNSHDVPQFNDTVTLTSRLLFDTDAPREGTVVAIADDGMVSVEFPQPGTSPMTVTAKAGVFTIVRRAEPRCPSCDHLVSIHQPDGCWYTVTTMPKDDVARPWDELRTSGLLWLVNRVVFHPRGFALGLVQDSAGETIGWSLLGDGREPWRFEEAGEQTLFDAARTTLTPTEREEP